MISSLGYATDLETSRMSRMFCLENQHSDDLPSKVQAVNAGSQDVFGEGILMNELDHWKRLSQTHLFRSETECEGDDPESTR